MISTNKQRPLYIELGFGQQTGRKVPVAEFLNNDFVCSFLECSPGHQALAHSYTTVLEHYNWCMFYSRQFYPTSSHPGRASGCCEETSWWRCCMYWFAIIGWLTGSEHVVIDNDWTWPSWYQIDVYIASISKHIRWHARSQPINFRTWCHRCRHFATKCSGVGTFMLDIVISSGPLLDFKRQNCETATVEFRLRFQRCGTRLKSHDGWNLSGASEDALQSQSATGVWRQD